MGVLLYAAQVAIDFIHIERLGVEGPSNPFQIFLVVGMVGIVHCIQEVLVAGDSAYVFRRAGAGALQAGGVVTAFFRWEDVFHEELVLPAVAKVVGVGKARIRTKPHRLQLVSAFVSRSRKTHLALVGYAVRLAPDEESVEVKLFPAHDGLQNAVELGDGDVGFDQDTPPDGWVRAAEGDLELVNLNGF